MKQSSMKRLRTQCSAQAVATHSVASPIGRPDAAASTAIQQGVGYNARCPSTAKPHLSLWTPQAPPHPLPCMLRRSQTNPFSCPSRPLLGPHYFFFSFFFSSCLTVRHRNTDRIGHSDKRYAFKSLRIGEETMGRKARVRALPCRAVPSRAEPSLEINCPTTGGKFRTRNRAGRSKAVPRQATGHGLPKRFGSAVRRCGGAVLGEDPPPPSLATATGV